MTEGTCDQKKDRIQHSNFLGRAYRSFAAIQGSLFLYGHSLAENDEHLLKLIDKGKLKKIFIGIYGDPASDTNRKYTEKYKGDAERVKRALRRERFMLPDECDFDYLYSKRDAANIGELINIALEKIEDANKAKLENVFRNIDFNSEPALGQTKERNRRLKHLLDDFNDPRLDLRPSRIGQRDIIGDVYEYLIGQFAAGAGKKAGEFYTPPEVSMLLAKLVARCRSATAL